MNKQHNPTAELRRRAEERLQAKKTVDAEQGVPTPAAADVQRLVHELQVHQIELEMQNEELRQSRAEVEDGLLLYTDLYDFAPVGYMTLNRDGMIHRINLTGARLLGEERRPLTGRRFVLFIFPSDRAAFNAFLEKVFASRVKETCEVTLQTEEKSLLLPDLSGNRRQGEANRFNVHVDAIVSEDGRKCRAVLVDITERKRAEAALRDQEQQIRTFLDATTDMAFLKDENFHHIMANHALCTFYGKRERDIIGKTDFDLLSAEAAAACRKTDEEALLANDLKISEEMVGGRYYETIKFPVDLATGRKGVGGYIRDITERKQAGEEITRLNEALEERVRQRTALLEAANRELESFCYSVSHDLRAPLRSIDGFSKIILEDYPDRPLDDTGKNHLARIRKATHLMGHLIDDLLKLSRVSRSEFRNVPVDLSRIVQALVDKRRQDDPERTIEVVVQEGIIVNGDRYLLEMVMSHLLENAWKFTSKEAHPRIEFGSLRQGEKTVCFLRDNGVGFDAKYVDKLFGAFQRLHSPEEFPGTGIGLATVKRIINRHGGRIWAEGEAGKGAIFYFTLP